MKKRFNKLMFLLQMGLDGIKQLAAKLEEKKLASH